jgi:hypothetical protein
VVVGHRGDVHAETEGQRPLGLPPRALHSPAASENARARASVLDSQAQSETDPALCSWSYTAAAAGMRCVGLESEGRRHDIGDSGWRWSVWVRLLLLVV